MDRGHRLPPPFRRLWGRATAVAKPDAHVPGCKHGDLSLRVRSAGERRDITVWQRVKPIRSRAEHNVDALRPPIGAVQSTAPHPVKSCANQPDSEFQTD